MSKVASSYSINDCIKHVIKVESKEKSSRINDSDNVNHGDHSQEISWIRVFLASNIDTIISLKQMVFHT